MGGKLYWLSDREWARIGIFRKGGAGPAESTTGG